MQRLWRKAWPPEVYKRSVSCKVEEDPRFRRHHTRDVLWGKRLWLPEMSEEANVALWKKVWRFITKDLRYYYIQILSGDFEPRIIGASSNCKIYNDLNIAVKLSHTVQYTQYGLQSGVPTINISQSLVTVDICNHSTVFGSWYKTFDHCNSHVYIIIDKSHFRSSSISLPPSISTNQFTPIH